MYPYSNRRFTSGYYGFYNPEFMVPCIATVFCSFVGCGFCLMGLIMTVTAYTSTAFPDSPTKVLGPVFLCLGFILVGVSVGLGCFAMKKKRAQESQTMQNQAVQGTCEPQPYSAYSAPNNPGPDVYDPERRQLTAGMPSSYSTSFGQTPASQVPYPLQGQYDSHADTKTEKSAIDVSSHPPYSEQPSYNPDFMKPVPL